MGLKSFFTILLLITPLVSLAQANEDNLLYVSADGGNLIVDTTGHQNFSSSNDGLAKQLGIQELNWEVHTIPDNLLPKALQIKRIELLTVKGRLSAKITRVTYQNGPSTGKLILITDQKEELPDFEGGLAKTGSPFPQSVKVRALTGITGNNRAVLKFVKPLKKWFASKITKEQKELHPRLKIADILPSDLRFVKGVFGPKGKWLSWCGKEFGETTFSYGERKNGKVINTILYSDGS